MSPSGDRKDHLGLLIDVGELSALLAGSNDFRTFLQQVVEMVARHLRADVASIYLYDDETEALRLEATHGLAPEAVGRVEMKLGEGLVGAAIKELRPLCEHNASANPKFKPFPGIGEERYESFLAAEVLKEKKSDRVAARLRSFVD
jgi:phosphotransferase system, enzyme I, PtsP